MRLVLFVFGIAALGGTAALALARGPLAPETLATGAVGMVALAAFRVTPPARRAATTGVVTQPAARRHELAELAGNLDALASGRGGANISTLPAEGGITVRLTSGGANQIAVIKALREHLDIGLKEAKDLTDLARAGRKPELARGMPPAKARALALAVERAGGRAEVS